MRGISLAFSSRTLSAVTHRSAAGSINQCAEQSAPSLIQSPLQQNAAIRTTEECVFTPLLCLCDLCVCASPSASRRRPETNPFRETKWEEEADREHCGEECCVKLLLPLSCSAQERQKFRRGARKMTVSFFCGGS